MSLFDELKKRKVFRAAVIYAVVAWAIIQVSDLVAPHLHLPDWIVTAIIIIAAIGFPVALVFAWLFDYQASPGNRAYGYLGLGMIIALACFAAYSSFGDVRSARHGNSVLVLPFVDMSPAHDQEYLSDGITEEILNALSKVPGLEVPARTTSFSFKGRNVTVSEIARELGVANVLEGSVRKQGDELRITVQLVDARSDKHIWSETYNRTLDDAFTVQDQITKSIVDALRLQLSEAGTAGPATASGRAHELYLQGLYYWNRRHADEVPLALESFHQATQMDPNYARAWAGLALTYAILPQYTKFERTEAVAKGKDAAARALRLDPRAADAEAALSQIAQELEHDWTAAEQHIERALRFDPRSATARHWHSELLSYLQRHDEAIAESNRALELDPLSSVIQHRHAMALFGAGRVEESLAEWAAIARRDPGYGTARYQALSAALMLGRYDDALKFATDSGTRLVVRATRDSTSRAMVFKLLADPAVRARSSYRDMAGVFAVVGMPDSALAMLNMAADRWEPGLNSDLISPYYRGLRDHPLYRQFLRKMNFPSVM